MSTINFNNIKNNAQLRLGKISNRNSDFEFNEFVPIVNAVELDWNGAEVDENKVINTTEELLIWIKEGLAAAAQSGSITPEQEETFNTATNLLGFIKDYALRTADADERYQEKGDYVLTDVYNENKAEIDAAIENLQQAVSDGNGGIDNEKIQELEDNISTIQAALSAKVNTNDLDEIIESKGYQTETQVNEKITAVVGTAPEALDTLQEIAEKLEDNDDVVSAIINTITTNKNDVYSKEAADSKFATKESIDELIEEVNDANETAAEALIHLQDQIDNLNVEGLQGEKGDTGETGPKGDKGDKGDTGTFDASVLEDYATKTFVNDAIENVVGAAPAELDTLKEIADWVSEHGEVTGIKGDTGETGPAGKSAYDIYLDGITESNAIYSFNSFDPTGEIQYGFGKVEVIDLQETVAKVKVIENNIDGFVGNIYNVYTLNESSLIELYSEDGIDQNIAVRVTLISPEVKAMNQDKWLESLKGPQGEQGPQGEKGDTGEQGPKGDTGTFDSSMLENYVTIAQYNELLERIAALEEQIHSDEPVIDDTYITPTTAKPTSASIAETGFPSQKPEEGLTLETSEITRPTELYLVYPSDWVVSDANDNIINPIITDTNGFEQGAWVDSIVTVNGVSYTIIGTELGKDNYTITFS